MEIYLVGGAVRDRLLGLPVREQDWVVVGAADGELENLGYRKVGRSFPVYLHPETNEEYALARTEKKIGPGYHGFEVNADRHVTLEEDLARRDLTINAIARDSEGQLIDPWNGQQDINNRLLRHVSEAFREDPVRILRVARFAARFHALGFSVATETLNLMTEMVHSGEADALIPERVWRETESALGEARPDIFFSVLRDSGALAVIYPELDALFGVPQPERWHPEIDTGVHILMALQQAARKKENNEVRFAVLTHDLGKGTTPKSDWPRHPGHEKRGVELVEKLCRRLGVPNRYRDLAVHTARFHSHCHRAMKLQPKTILEMLETIDAFRRPDRFDNFLAACKADARGRKGLEDQPYPQATLLSEARTAAAAVNTLSLHDKNLKGPAVGEAIRRARIDAIKKVNAGFAD